MNEQVLPRPQFDRAFLARLYALGRVLVHVRDVHCPGQARKQPRRPEQYAKHEEGYTVGHYAPMTGTRLFHALSRKTMNSATANVPLMVMPRTMTVINGARLTLEYTSTNAKRKTSLTVE